MKIFSHGAVLKRRSQTLLALWILADCLAVAAISQGAEPSPEVEADFRREYAAAAQALMRQHENLRCRMRLQARWEQAPFEERLFVKGPWLGEERIALTAPLRGGMDRKVLVNTSEQVYQLWRMPDAQEFRVMEHSGSPTPSEAAAAQGLAGTLLFAAFAIGGEPIARLIELPAFRLESIAGMSADGPVAESVEITFSLADAPNNLVSGTISFAPRDGWVVTGFRECEFVDPNVKIPVFADCEISYRMWPTGIRFPERIRTVERNTFDNTTRESFIAETLEVSLGDVTDDEFQLSAFGVNSLPRKPVHWPRVDTLTLVVAGCAALAVACVIIAWRLRRRSG